MIRGLLIPVDGDPHLVEAADWFEGNALQDAVGNPKYVVSIALPTPRIYRPKLRMYFAGDLREQPVNKTATTMAGARLGIHPSVRGPALVLVNRSSGPSDLALMDLLTLAMSVVAAELKLPTPK